MKIKRGKANIVLILGIIFLIIGGVLLWFVAVHENYKNMPVTKITDANDDQTVKIDGVITSSQNNRNPVIWVIEEYKDVDGEEEKETTYHYVNYFWVADSSGSIKVIMRSGASPHFATEDQYYIGSGISVVGKVNKGGNETTIKAEAIAPEPDAFGAPLWIKIITALMLLGGGFFIFMFIRHKLTNKGKSKRIIRYGNRTIEISDDILDASEDYED
jgi:hypothetical protein